MVHILEVIKIANETNIVKCRLDTNLYDAFKEVLNVKKTTQQDFIEMCVKDFVLANLKLVIEKSKGSK